MDILQLIQSRRSVREYQSKPIPKSDLQKIVEAGLWAPSSMGMEPWRFVVVSHPETLSMLTHEAQAELARYLRTSEAEAKYGQANCERFMPRAEGEDELFYGAPAIIFIISTREPSDHFDHGLAAQNMMLCAHGLGVASCCIGLAEPLNNSQKVRKQFEMKPEEKLVIALIFGYSAEAPHNKTRKEDGVRWI